MSIGDTEVILFKRKFHERQIFSSQSVLEKGHATSGCLPISRITSSSSPSRRYTVIRTAVCLCLHWRRGRRGYFRLIGNMTKLFTTEVPNHFYILEWNIIGSDVQASGSRTNGELLTADQPLSPSLNSALIPPHCQGLTR